MGGIGLALGGGGVTGCAHIGIICALEEEGIPVDYLAGTSAGAMAAVLYACGYSGEKLGAMVKEITGRLLDYDYWGVLAHVCLPRRPLSGMIRGRRLKSYLDKAVGTRTVAELTRPLAVTATDLAGARQVLFTNRSMNMEPLAPGTEAVGDVSAVDAVMASMSIPGLFRPVTIGNRLLVDGGLMDNCPAAALKAMGAGRLLAVDLVSVRPLPHARWTFAAIASRSVSLGLHRMSQSEAAYSDLVLAPDMGSIGLLDFACASQCMERGYDCARRSMDAIRRLAEAGGP